MSCRGIYCLLVLAIGARGAEHVPVVRAKLSAPLARTRLSAPSFDNHAHYWCGQCRTTGAGKVARATGVDKAVRTTGPDKVVRTLGAVKVVITSGASWRIIVFQRLLALRRPARMFGCAAGRRPHSMSFCFAIPRAAALVA